MRTTSFWVALVIATRRSTAASTPSPNDSGSIRTTRSNSSPFASSGPVRVDDPAEAQVEAEAAQGGR
nr:hypothetical protein [Glycomyces tenuis]